MERKLKVEGLWSDVDGLFSLQSFVCGLLPAHPYPPYPLFKISTVA